MIAHLSAAAAILAMLCAILTGVIPILAREPSQSRALKAWLDTWLPLLLALPIAIVPLFHDHSGLLSPMLVLSLIDLIPVALVALIIAGSLVDRRCRAVQSIDGSHVIALVAIALVLALASFTGRLMDWAGHLLLTSAVLWLWTVSSEPAAAARAESGHADPVFLVDWTGPLQNPIGGLAQTLLLLSPLVLLLSVLAGYLSPAAAPSRPLGVSWSLLSLLALPAACQGAALIGLWWAVGPAAAIRCSVSTVILTVLLGVGVLCVRLIPWVSLMAGLRAGVEGSYEVTDLTGLSALMLPALLLLALAALGLAPLCSRRTLLAMGLGLGAASLVALVMGLSLARSHWPAPLQPADPPSIAPLDPAQGDEHLPQSNTGTFLQDSSI